MEDKDWSGAPNKFKEEELEALLLEDPYQTLAELVESFGDNHTLVLKRLKSLRIIQNQGHWVPYELKPKRTNTVSTSSAKRNTDGSKRHEITKIIFI